MLQTVLYRFRQVRQQLGLIRPLTAEERAEVIGVLASPSAQHLFETMSDADQQHGFRVYRALRARGCVDADLLIAGLLHDVGKAAGSIPFWTRPTIVLCKKLAPRLLPRLTVKPERLYTEKIVRWKQALSYAWWHAEIGADLASEAGLSPQTVLYIRTHHQPQGPASLLHEVDEVN